MKQVQKVVSDFKKANKLTNDELASKLGLKRSSFYGKLRGKTEYTLHEAYTFSRELGCTLDEFYLMTITEQ